MRHKVRGRTLNRNASHRKAMFRNMAVSLISTLESVEGAVGAPKVPGRIITTVEKAKELRPFVEKLVTLARKALVHEQAAREFAAPGARDTAEWKAWRDGEGWQKWNQAIAPAVTLRRRAFAALRDKDAVRILFAELGPRFMTRPGGYTRIVRLAEFRLGDAGRKAIIEFVGVRDRTRSRRRAPLVKKMTDDAAVVAPVVASPAEAAAPVAE